jgi:hypothetical protein
MNEYLTNPDVCQSSLNEHDEPVDPTNTAHVWSDEAEQDRYGDWHFTCEECGDKKPPAFQCPLCSTHNVKHYEHNGTHIYGCYSCPFVAVEFVHDVDARNLLDYLKVK